MKITKNKNIEAASKTSEGGYEKHTIFVIWPNIRILASKCNL
jgi:hypothetical protein